MGGDVFAVLRQELFKLECQLETCPSTTQEIAAVLNAQMLEVLGYSESMAAQRSSFRRAGESNGACRN